MKEDEKLKKALLKKALGYTADEVVTEYTFDEEGQLKLSKKKVTKKHYSPDIAAMRVLFEKFYTSFADEVSQMSDEEIEEEMERLLKVIKEESGGNKRNKTKNEM